MPFIAGLLLSQWSSKISEGRARIKMCVSPHDMFMRRLSSKPTTIFLEGEGTSFQTKPLFGQRKSFQDVAIPCFSVFNLFWMIWAHSQFCKVRLSFSFSFFLKKQKWQYQGNGKLQQRLLRVWVCAVRSMPELRTMVFQLLATFPKVRPHWTCGDDGAEMRTCGGHGTRLNK